MTALPQVQASTDAQFIVDSDAKFSFSRFRAEGSRAFVLLHGDALQRLTELPDGSIDCVVTSPPYWGQREYSSDGIGLERTLEAYIDNLSSICEQLHRVLSDRGSFWLNIGDTYVKKKLSLVPHRVAIELCDRQGWTLRNDVIWNKIKGGMDTSRDRLGNVHEHMFHFVKQPRGYFYDADAIRNDARKSKIVNGAVVSATGVSGVRYRRQIELSTALTSDEKRLATAALDDMLLKVSAGEYSDFRMVIRGQQRSTHSDSSRLSGRAKELAAKGFYFLRYHPKGSKPADVWDIIPEDTQGRETHFAPFPLDLCRIPVLATCPPDGVLLDPFCGTGTALMAAREIGRRSIGIDTSREYLEYASERCESL